MLSPDGTFITGFYCMKFFSLNFGGKMVNITDLDYSPDAISEMRQVLCYFPEYLCLSEENQCERS